MSIDPAAILALLSHLSTQAAQAEKKIAQLLAENKQLRDELEGRTPYTD